MGSQYLINFILITNIYHLIIFVYFYLSNCIKYRYYYSMNHCDYYYMNYYNYYCMDHYDYYSMNYNDY